MPTTDLTWTREPPTVGGWYWWRDLGEPRDHPQIYLVNIRNGIAMAWISEQWVEADNDLDIEWAGPIEPPA